MNVWYYGFAGLLFESAVHIPEWDAFASGEAGREPDVRIFLDHDAAAVADDTRPFVSPTEYRFWVPRVGGFRIVNGSQITVAPATGADDREVRLFLLGSVLAALGVQRDLLLLHASVVRLDDRTIALCGPAGSGKSTTAAALIDRGAALICDDLGRFDVIDGRAVVFPSTPRLKLHPEALEALQWPAQGLDRVHSHAKKFHVPQAQRDPRLSIPLDAIYLLVWAGGAVEITALTGLASLRTLVDAATYRSGLLDPMGKIGAHWQRCAALAAVTPVYRLARPRHWPVLPAVVAALEARRTQGTHLTGGRARF